MGRLKSAAALALGLALLGLAARDAAPERVLAALGSAQVSWLLVALALDAGVFALKSLKWRFVFLPVARLPLSTFFSGIAVGALSNTLLPLRLDEVVRSFYFGVRTGVPKATVLGTILVERLVDATTLLAAMALLVGFYAGPASPAYAIPVLLALLSTGAASLALLAWKPDSVERFLAGAGRAGALAGVRSRLAAGLAVLGPLRLASLFAFAAAEWLVATLHVAAALRAFDVALPFMGNLAVVTSGYLGFALPSAPGGLGVYDLLVKTSLTRGFSLDPSTALSCTLVLHALLVVPVSLAGAVILARDGLSLSRLRAMATRPADAPGAEAHEH